MTERSASLNRWLITMRVRAKIENTTYRVGAECRQQAVQQLIYDEHGLEIPSFQEIAQGDLHL